MEYQWYVLQVYSNYEKKVMAMLEDRIKQLGLSEQFADIVVPTEEIVEMKGGQKKTSERKFFPGYILIKMIMTDETWHLVKNTPKGSTFLGSKGKPTPISNTEAAKIIEQVLQGIEKPKPSIEFEVGEIIKVIDGPFASFNGLVEETDEERSKLKVSVMIFGRPTPVELEFNQVEKIQ